MRHNVDKVNQIGAAAPDEVVEAMHAVVHALRSRNHEALREAGVELTPLEGRVLGFFARHPGATQRDLGEHSGRDKGQLARLVRRLHELGLLELTPDPDDRRTTRVRLSPAAQRLHQSVQRQRQRLALAALEGIGEEQRRQLCELLLRMRLNLQPQA